MITIDPGLSIWKIVHVGAPPPARMQPQIAARAPLPQWCLTLGLSGLIYQLRQINDFGVTEATQH